MLSALTHKQIKAGNDKTTQYRGARKRCYEVPGRNPDPRPAIQLSQEEPQNYKEYEIYYPVGNSVMNRDPFHPFENRFIT